MTLPNINIAVSNNDINEYNKFNYMMLDRLRSDCEYFLYYGRGNVKHLYYNDINRHISEMKRLWNSFSANEKPEWLSYQEIEHYENKMLSYTN